MRNLPICVEILAPLFKGGMGQRVSVWRGDPSGAEMPFLHRLGGSRDGIALYRARALCEVTLCATQDPPAISLRSWPSPL